MQPKGGGGPVIHGGSVVFAFQDGDGALAGVRLVQEREIAPYRLSLEFVRQRGSPLWQLRVPRPSVDRIEYQLELVHWSGATEVICDPANPRRAPGPFGEKSVVELPGYRAPRWLGHGGPRGERRELSLPGVRGGTSTEGLLWSSAGSVASDPLPLLIAHDGVEYADYSALVELLDAMTHAGELPPMRSALLAPEERTDIYSASPRYAARLAREIIPGVAELAPTPDDPRMRVGMGASLGALAMLHAQRTEPVALGALFLQSGSFFRPNTREEQWDPTSAGRITEFVGDVLATGSWPRPVPVTMTCGRLEENMANNRAMRDALAAQGYDVQLHETRDLHNWVGWRDAFHPHLVRLLKRMWT